MTSWTGVAVSVMGAMVGVGLFARITAALARRRAPRALALVRRALDRRRADEARRLLPGAFYVPASGRYRPAGAALALKALRAFEETMAAYGLSAEMVTRDLRDALKRSGRRGGQVPWRLLSSFMRVLWALAPRDAPLLKVIRAAAEQATQEEGASWEDEDEVHEVQLLSEVLAPSRVRDRARGPLAPERG